MDLGPCKFTDASSEKDAARIAVGMGWKPPAGHASWCWVERTPWDRAGLRYDVGGYSRGNGKPFSRACVCGKSDLSRHIRKLEALAGAR